MAILGQHFYDLSNLRTDPHLSRLLPSPVVGDQIAGVAFADLLRHLRDTACQMRTIMEPAECYRLEVQQMTILSWIIIAASNEGGDTFAPRPPALIDAFASNKMITYSASLLRDPRADLLRALSTTMPYLSFDFVNWGEGIFSSWWLLINDACKNGDNRLAVELVDSSFVFLMEKWSLLAPEPMLGTSNTPPSLRRILAWK